MQDMLYEDLMSYGGSDSEQDRRIRGKYAAEMAYYAVLEQVISRYAPADARNISFYNNDLLAMARDEMAKYASQSGRVRYVPGSDGLVEKFTDDAGNEYDDLTGDALRDLVRGCFRSSEAIHNIVTTHLCSSSLRNKMLSDEEIQVHVDEAFDAMLNEADAGSAFSTAVANAGQFYGDRDGLYGKYSTVLPVYRVDGNFELADSGERVRGLKISPLVPEMRVMRQSGYFAAELGITAKQNSIRNDDALARNNPVLTFDPDKRVLYNINDTEPLRNGTTLSDVERSIFRTGVSFGIPDTWKDKASRRPGHLHAGEPPMPLFQAGRVNSHMSKLFAFRMAHILDRHSYQMLTDDDYSAVDRIFTHVQPNPNGTIFGNFRTDPDGAAANADAYMQYIEHVCSVAEDHMQSHEFEIHLEPQNAFASEEYGKGYVPLLYFTGERTSEFRRARSNGARFMSVYPYASYVPKDLNGLPVMGDAAPASYSGYVFTKQEHRSSDTDQAVNSRTDNPYVSGRLVTADMCREMSDIFDAYADPARTAAAGVSLARIQHSVGDTGVKDLSVFISGDGSVDGDAIIRTLVEDMNAVKLSARTSFKTEANGRMLRRVFDRFRDRWTGGDRDEDGKPLPLDAAIWMYVNDRSKATGYGHGRTMNYFRENLANELEGHLVRELRTVNGDDIDSFEATRHMFRAYISEFVNAVDNAVAGKSKYELSREDSFHGFGTDGIVDGLAAAVSDDGDRRVDKALRELYGSGSAEEGIRVDPDVPQTLIIKANTLRNASTSMYPGDYEDLLSMLSYSNRAKYEPAPDKSADEVRKGLDTAGTYAAIQLYSSSNYDILGMSGAVAEDVDDERTRPEDDTDAPADPIADQKAWFDAAFSVIGGEDDRTLEWAESRAFSGKPVEYQTKNGETVTGVHPEAIEHAKWVASHPLTMEAMRRVGAAMQDGYGERYSASRVGVTPQGVVYYLDESGEPVIKIGPVLDEAAYMRPSVSDVTIADVDPAELEWDAENGRVVRRGTKEAPDDLMRDPETFLPVEPWRTPEGWPVEFIDRPRLDENGWPVRDEQGMAQTEWVPVSICLEPRLNEDDATLMNPVMFGALDFGDGSVPNRMYGMSLKMRNQDGYHFEPFTDRMSFSTYQMNVLENLNRSLALYEASKTSELTRFAAARSTMYSSISGNSLRKAYRTNTMVMLDKPMCKVADTYLSGYVGMFDDIDAEVHANTVSNMFAAQADEMHNRCVLSKTTEDQNVGLFNQARHLQQARADRVVGDMDRKNMLRTDCIGARAMIFQENPYFDIVSTGTARTVGTVAYMSDACAVGRLDGSVRLDPKAVDGAATRSRIISLGITDVNTGELDARFVRYPGGQAVDRLQLSMNGARKAVHYASDMKFAMVNLGYNMEDGYIVAKRSAEKLGHFNDKGEFVPLAEWDKIGDTQSGNKGVVAKIVDTDIETDADFMADFTYKFLQLHAFNHSANGNAAAAGPVEREIQGWLERHSSDERITLEDYVKSLKMERFEDYPETENVTVTSTDTVGTLLESMRDIQLGLAARKGKKSDEEADAADRAAISELRAVIKRTMHDMCADLGNTLLEKGVEPFAGSYGIEHATWQLFNDNPDLEMAVTNVCVCTRSNPSILMHINEALEEDNAYLAEHEDDPGFDRDGWIRDHASSALVTRNENGDPVVSLGACGHTPVYVDCHYADDKNKDYTKQTRKAGRGWGMQEAYALLAKHSVAKLLPYVTANDPALPKALAKLNRRAMMNGFAFDTNTSDLRCRKINDLFDDTALDKASGDGILKASSDRPDHVFVDMAALADRFIDMIPEGTSQRDIDAALAKIGEEQDFTKLMAVIHGTKPADMNTPKTDEGLRSLFITLAGQYGGAFLLEYESPTRPAVMPTADIGMRTYDEEEGGMVPKYVRLYTGISDGTAEGEPFRTAVPLFLSNREVHNSDGDIVSSPSEDRLQFKIFKAELGMALAGRMDERDRGDGIPFADSKTCTSVLTDSRERIANLYRKVSDEKSLTLEDMSFWLKKNLYRMTFPNSLTCVWHGDPSLEIDECGISFEKAKSLKLLRPRKDADLSQIPDTYEFMHERYEPLTDEDFVMVNRSPGQTTGCIRALRAKITGPDGDGITIHPALATIFDGDFDGDTVGVINPRTAEAMDAEDPAFEALRHAAMAELAGRMSMKANMVNKAQFTEIGLPDGTKAEYMHPLFIAGNADLAVALHNMSKDGPDGTTRCGYDAKHELDAVTAMANMIEQLRQCAYDFENADEQKIGMDDAFKIAGIRLDMAAKASRFFDETEDDRIADKLFGDDEKADVLRDDAGKCVMTRKDWEDRKAWREIAADFKAAFGPVRDDVKGRRETDPDGKPGKLVRTKPSLDLRNLSRLEERTFHRLADCYRGMAGYMSDPPLMTHGDSALDIMYNIVSDANISKKGKEPQLNALLQFSGMHADCVRGDADKAGYLSVAKVDGKFSLMANHRDADGNLAPMKLERQPDGSYRLDHDGIDYGTFDAPPAMNYRSAVSDIAPTPYANAVMMNIIAQSDKADATGIGGSMAQKMQKVLAPMGYGELALRISGPLVQQYLDSKQNVRNCDKNLKIGKTILNKVAAGARINELTAEHFRGGNAVHQQVYNGQYTIGERQLTAEEYVDQMDNFLQVMRQPGLSPLDRAQFEAVMRSYEEDEIVKTKDPVTGRVKTEKTGRQVVGNPIRKADATMDMVYAAIYSGDDPAAFANHMDLLESTDRGLYSGSRIFENRVDASRLQRAMTAASRLPDLGMAVERCVDCARPDGMTDAKTADVEQSLKQQDSPLPESSARPEHTAPAVKKVCQDKLDKMRELYRSTAKDGQDGPGKTDDIGDDW